MGSHLEGHAHGTRDVDAEEQQSFFCERLFLRMEQKQVVVVTGGGLLWQIGVVDQVLAEVARVNLRRRTR